MVSSASPPSMSSVSFTITVLAMGFIVAEPRIPDNVLADSPAASEQERCARRPHRHLLRSRYKQGVPIRVAEVGSWRPDAPGFDPYSPSVESTARRGTFLSADPDRPDSEGGERTAQ